MPRLNPYADFGTTITGERFIGRDAELRTIESRIFGVGGFGSIAVLGLPRIGKTSLISEAIRRAESRAMELRTVVVRVDVGTFDSANGLLRALCEELVEDIRSQELGGELFETQIQQALAAPTISFNEVRTVFKSIRRARIRPVCVLDEFDAGRRVFVDTPQCFHWLRELCSNPEFKAAVVLVSKRSLQDVARLAGYESDYWANVLMTLPLRTLSDDDVNRFFSELVTEGVFLGEAEQREILDLCGSHPFLLDAVRYYAWQHAEQGQPISVDWVKVTCGKLAQDYVQQVSTILGDGPMLSKTIQILVGPQWDVTLEDVDALYDLGVVLRDESGRLRGFSSAFEQHLRFAERNIDIWPLWREAERMLRDVLEHRLEQTFGKHWPEALAKARPKRKTMIANCQKRRDRERHIFGASAASSLLAYTYPMDLYELMVSDWKNLGEPLLGSNKEDWGVKFKVLAKVRTPLAHNREEAVTEGERLQAEGYCQEILDRYRKLELAEDSLVKS